MHGHFPLLLIQTNLDGIFPVPVEPATMPHAGNTKEEVSRALLSRSLKSIGKVDKQSIGQFLVYSINMWDKFTSSFLVNYVFWPKEIPFTWKFCPFDELSSNLCFEVTIILEFPRRHSGKESACQCRSYKRWRFNPWVRKIPWSRKWQPLLRVLPGKFCGQGSLVGYGLCYHKETDITEQQSTHTRLQY